MLVTSPVARGRGFSIIEFMIAMTLSVMVLAALTAAFVANSRSRTEIERANEQMENGRFALQILTDDIELAGFYSYFNVANAKLGGRSPTSTALATSIENFAAPDNAGNYWYEQSPVGAKMPNPCAVTVAQLNGAFMMHIQGFDNLGALTTDLSGCLADFKAGTDIVVIRRTATCVEGSANCGTVAGAAYFQASLCETDLNDVDPTTWYTLSTSTFPRLQRDCSTRADKRQFLTHIYFVANNDRSGDGVPTLKRAELGANAAGTAPAFSIVSLAHGIDNLQIEYGLDSNADGAPETFSAAPTSVQNWRDVMAVRLYVLARNSTVTRDYVNTKVYTLGTTAGGATQCANGTGTCLAFNDGTKRHVYQTSVRLNNPAGRRE